MFSAQGDKNQYTEVEQLSALSSIAVLKDDFRHKILSHKGLNNIHEYANWQLAIDAVLDGSNAAIFFSDPGMQYFCATKGNDCNALTRVFMYQTMRSYLVLSKVESNKKLVQKLMIAAEQYKNTTEFAELSQQWLKQYESQPIRIPMHIENGVLNLWDQ
ncbi:transporter substrate-binding domain-containing protein [Aliiglaciecola sp. LCG003]|uniref:transporter substrate-binding domain-containing protein n=1 Tax=Aliiglaciecola sp. LCG003 TaxID=3053655 RepID=UPI003365794D